MIIEECEVQRWRAAKTLESRKPRRCADHEKTRFHGVAARNNNLTVDRNDLQFAAKELCRKMARPKPKDWDTARRISTPWSPGVPIRAAQTKKLDGFADSDWAGERPSKSTSGGALRWCGRTLKSWSSRQTTTVLSSAEAELHAMSKCAQQTASLIGIARTSGLSSVQQFTVMLLPLLGSLAGEDLEAKSVMSRCSILWIQDAVENKEPEIGKVGTLENPADMLTKFLANDALHQTCTEAVFVFQAWEDQCPR